MSRTGQCLSVARDVLGEGLLAPLRALAGGDELQSAGTEFLARARGAVAADEAVILVVAGQGPAAEREPSAGEARAGGTAAASPAAAGAAFLAGPHHGQAGPGGPLGTRAGDHGLAAAAATAGAPQTNGEAGSELWCPMVVERRPVGVLAVRRGERPFLAEERVLLEALATSAAMAVDRLRFCRLWSQKLEQADAAHSQLLRYADDLRITYASERRRSEELSAALEAVELSYIATVRALATAVEAKDAYTGGHIARVTAYGMEVCEALGDDLTSTPGLEYAFLLHDLGKIGVPDAVLSKAGPLTDEEWALMRRHPAIGLRILEGVPHMDVVRAVVHTHHEHWDGSGYPQGLRGEAIPRAARVFAVVDAFDAITTDRPYRAGASLDEALARLRAASGTQFAPDAVEAIHQVERERLVKIHATATARGG